MSKTMINENKLFRILPFFFDNPSDVLIELAQNSQRAGASYLAINLKDNELVAKDNGHGTENPEAILTLASSQWDKEVEESQNPAGFGLFFLICISTEVLFRSRFGSIKIDCNRYLNDHFYRDGILSEISTQDKIKTGFFIRANIKMDIFGKVIADTMKLAFFPLDITVNGQQAAGKDLISLCMSKRSNYVRTEYLGNTVLVNPYNIGEHFPGPYKLGKSNVFALFYGIQIPYDKYCYDSKIIIDIRQGSPVTPKLPYRDSLIDDGKMDSFLEFCREEAVKHCTQTINDYDPATSKPPTYSWEVPHKDIIALMHTMSRIATPEELNALNKFYLMSGEPHSNTETEEDTTYSEKLVCKGDGPVINETVRVIIYRNGCKGEEDHPNEDEQLALPKGTITSVWFADTHPEWIEGIVESKSYDIELHYDTKENTLNGAHTWHKGEIKSEKKIPILSLADGYREVEIFYADSPKDIDLIEDTIFCEAIYYSDGDSYDTQRSEFDDNISKDLSKILEEYNLQDLLGGINQTGIRLKDIVSIKVANKALIVRTKDGKKQALKLAA